MTALPITNSRRTRLAAGALASLMALAACGGTPEGGGGGEDLKGKYPASIELADDIDKNGHFDFAVSTYPPGWDPIQSISGYDFTALAAVYDRLVYGAPDGTIEPMLATSWETQDDGKSLVLKLREGVTFSDGTPFNAEAVKINLDRARAEGSRIAAEISQLTEVEVIDEYTVKLKVESGSGALLGALAQRSGMMASPQAITAGTLADQATGAGAYTVTDFVPGASANYAKREGYWDPDAQNVATMSIWLMQDDQTRLNALQSGELDGTTIRPAQAVSAEGMDMQVISRAAVNFLYITVNSSVEPFNDPKVREAINYAIDRESIANGLFEGLCDPQIQPWPADSFAYSDEIGNGLEIWPYDPEKAKELLAEAGYPDGGIDLPLVTTSVTYVQQLSEVLQSQLKDVGINISIEAVPAPQVIEQFSVKKTSVANVNPYSGNADPHGFASRHLLPGAIYDVGEPVDQSILDLAMEAASPIDPEDRAPIYQQMMQAMIDHPTHVMPICALHAAGAYDSHVSGTAMYSAGFIDLRGVAVSKES